MSFFSRMMDLWNGHARRYYRANKGLVKREPREEAALRVRMLDGRHPQDVIDRCYAEMGGRALKIGPIDLSQCPLVDYAERRGRAYRTPPCVTGLGGPMAAAIGDASASVTVQKYLTAGGRPMPTVMVRASADALRYRLGCNWVGMAVGWSEREQRPWCQVVTPDDLDLTYASDSPNAPTVIRWYRTLPNGDPGCDVSDLTDLDRPRYVVEDEDGKELQVFEGEDYWWRYKDGRPFHRIIISGDPLNPYRLLTLVEGSLRIATGYTGWWAGMRDAAYPSKHAIDLDLDGMDASTGEGTGIDAGPEIIYRWRTQKDRAGSITQLGPGYDPEVIGRALRNYIMGLLTSSGLPVNFEGTGGDPSETELKELQETVQATYPECRGQDVLAIRRMAAITNRAMEASTGTRKWPQMNERGYGVLYREEVAEALADVAVKPTEEDDDGRREESTSRDQDDAGEDRGGAEDAAKS